MNVVVSTRRPWITVSRGIVARNAGNGLLIERGGLATLRRTVVLENGAEARLFSVYSHHTFIVKFGYLTK